MTGSFVIIGDGIAGSSAAETIREQDPDADITVITDEGEPLYNRILIKEFAKGKLPEAPIAIHDESWYEERSIDLRLNTRVATVEPDEGRLETAAGQTFTFDKLLIATGGTPAQLPAPGANATGIHHFWTFQDARAIRQHIETASTGVIVGAGLLGIDLAAVCGAQGLDATYLMRGNRWWRGALSDDGAEIVHDAMRDIGVDLAFNVGVDSFEVEDGAVTATIDSEGTRHPSDWVGVAIGLHFNTEFLQGTDVTCDWGIVVDEYMRTTHPDVYAAGDITRYHDYYLGESTQNGSWGSAKEQGRIAAINMVRSQETPVGPKDAAGDLLEPFRWVPSYSITHFDIPFLSFGHPTEGDQSIERRFSDTEWRRLTFADGRLVGGVLLGDLAPQTAYKGLIRSREVVIDHADELLRETVDLDEIAVAPES